MIHHFVTAAVTTCSALKPSGSGGYLGPIAKPIASVLAAFYSIIPNYGVAILALSVVWMIIISPLTLKTTRSMLAMQKLQPQLKKLQEQHKNDRQAFAQAQMDLFKEHNVSPFGSCLPSILPLPVFFALFRVIDGLSHTTTIHNAAGQLVKCSVPNFLSGNTQMYKDIVNAHGAINAFGLNLAKNALSPHSTLFSAAPYFILLLIMIGTQYAQTAQMMSRNPAAANNPQMKMMKFLPIIFGVICVKFPAGVVLYYGMSNLCRIGQQSMMYRYDPKVRALVAQEVIEVEDRTTEIDDGGARGRRKSNPKAVGSGKPGPNGRAGPNSKAGSNGKSKPPTSLAKKPPPAKTPPPPEPRSRFQKLLASANEQQSQRNASKGSSPAGSKGPQQSPAGSKGPQQSPAGSKGPQQSPAGSKGPQQSPAGSKGPQQAPAKGSAATSTAAKPASGPANGGPGRQVGGGGRTNGEPSLTKSPNARLSPTPTSPSSARTGGRGGGGKNGGSSGAGNSAPRTGAGRTGARSGNNKKRRGR